MVGATGFLLLGKKNLAIEGFTIEGFCDAAIQVRSGNPADATPENSAAITLRGNVVRGGARLGIDVSAEGVVVVENNVASGNGGSGISIQSCAGAPPLDATPAPEPTPTPSPRCRVGPSGPVLPVLSNNRVDGNGSHGMFIADAESGLVQNNEIFANGATGVTLRGAPDFLLINNLIFRNGEEGVAAGSAGRAAPNVMIVNNTFYDNAEWGVEIGSPGGTSPGALVLNNIFQRNGCRRNPGACRAEGGGSTPGGPNGIGVLNENVAPLEGVRSTCGYVAGFNVTVDAYGFKTPRNVYDVIADPAFVDADGGDFRLRSGSPAIDAGSTGVGSIGLGGSTAPDGRPDSGRIDAGFHYGASPLQMLRVPAPFMPLYVRARGSDLNDGKSPADAFRTITTAARRAQAGVSVIVGPGTYAECAVGPPADGGKASFIADALGARTGDRLGPVLVDSTCCGRDGQGQCRAGEAGFLLESACFAVVDGFHVRGGVDAGVQVTTGSHGSEVRNNVCFSNQRRGIQVSNAHDVRIVNNLAYANGGGGIQVGGRCAGAIPGNATAEQIERCRNELAGSKRALLQNNTTYANAVNGILVGSGEGVSSHATVLYNVMQADGENGLQVGDNTRRAVHLEGFRADYNVNHLFRYGAGLARPLNDRGDDPRFVDPAGPDGVLGGNSFRDDDFYLSQQAAGQAPPDSPAVDWGDVSAAEAGMAGRSTRSDGAPDSGPVDAGYHPLLAGILDPVGDCDGDGRISVGEIVQGVNIALGRAAMSACPAIDWNLDGRVAVDEIVRAVSASMLGAAR
jgi:parallel beta-helix repeat protein